jgi:hypothetical protein
VRGIPPEDPESPLHKIWLRSEFEEMKELVRRERLAEFGDTSFYLDFDAEIVPPPFVDGYTFEAFHSGLPTAGLWQMNFTIDDMNGDGVNDLVFPPTRKGTPHPWIYFGTAEGGFRPVSDIRWSSKVPFDYGGVATGDFDGDGNRDIVLAIHLKAQYVLYGDGAGGFERSQRLPNADPRITSRAPAVADFDGDGRQDVAFLAEIDYDLGTAQRIEDAPSVWVVRNLPGGWKHDGNGMPGNVIGDNLRAADVNGDGRPDLMIGANASNWRSLVLFNTEEGWVEDQAEGVLSNAYHYGTATFEGDDGLDMFWTFVQFRMVDGENKARTGVIPYEFGDKGLEAPGGPIFVDDRRYDPVWRVAAGDLTGDGRPDVVIGRKNGGLDVFVQTDSGDFYLEQSPELEDAGRVYHIEIVDINGDGRSDIVAAFAGDEKRPGGARAWLTRERS